MEEEEGKKSQQKVTALGRGASLPRRESGKLIPNFTSLELLVVIETKGVFCCFVFIPNTSVVKDHQLRSIKVFKRKRLLRGKRERKERELISGRGSRFGMSGVLRSLSLACHLGELEEEEEEGQSR